ncbi:MULTISPECIES: PIN domain-containing protein [Rhodococcus]|uniref:PIN domain-containing protein n=1 Tax=Rhodococcus oxybenzonivorans TaxID=1990687 RepID=A0AAE4UXN1_9NOCA|nr:MULTISPECIES: PIN domain-containing protein [Rhodococcus]MDV7242990.1 PIN domain-containing protein [Rhodococcus oxybenzonivorans]MDV7264466.1 PIN domain-containing protein [Rhodococcus oxybenzonivorans]MDV7275394.1 PIN domain-containing protein [Rhodococcus oxybenzonivorans]MDV7334751.1 PIN domain-containing protein [Rhodococcus oxybenzonivorans]MDV7344905.1 PIN domain-containing protein [Rhodococcus oxybenzonivorans]
MLIVLDTSAVTRDSRFETFVRTAVNRGVRVAVPRLVLLEIADRYQRESAAMIEALTVQARMYDRLGLREDLSLFVDVARAKAGGYVVALARELEKIGVEVVEPVGCSHVEIAQRAVQRRRPYREKKRYDGYAATVNWLTVLDLADRHPDGVVWVSANTRSFGGGEPPVWHDDIAAELRERRLDGRVWWATSLADVDLHTEDLPGPEPEPVILDSSVPRSAPPAEQERPGVPDPPPVTVPRPRAAPQRIPPSGKADSGGRRGFGKMIGGRTRRVSIVEELDDVDFG